MGTYGFNILMIWFFTVILYIVLYYDGLKKALNLFGNKQH